MSFQENVHHLETPNSISATKTGAILKSNARAALLVAHPGHELRVHGWLEHAQPVVFVLTDGSGSTGKPRLNATRRVLDAAGARPGSIYGWLSDRAFYSEVLNGEIDKFIKLAKDLAQELISNRIEYVTGDQVEGYNPAHDICRCLIDAAVALANQRGCRIANFEFPLMSELGESDSNVVSIELDEPAFERKINVARSYIELSGEVDAALTRWNSEQLRVERFSPVLFPFASAEPSNLPPFYESYGEQQVKAGIYRQVIRYRDHVFPVLQALRARGDRGDR